MRGYDRMDGAPSARLGDDDRAAQGDRPPPRPGAPARAARGRPATPRRPTPARAGSATSTARSGRRSRELREAQREAVALRYAGRSRRTARSRAALDCSEEAARRRVADGLAALRKTIDREEATAMSRPTHDEITRRSRAPASSSDAERGRGAACRARRARRAWPTSPTRASTRPTAPATWRRPTRGLVSLGAAEHRRATTSSTALAAEVSPRMLELPGAARRRPPRARRVLRAATRRDFDLDARLAAGPLGASTAGAARDREAARSASPAPTARSPRAPATPARIAPPARRWPQPDPDRRPLPPGPALRRRARPVRRRAGDEAAPARLEGAIELGRVDRSWQPMLCCQLCMSTRTQPHADR